MGKVLLLSQDLDDLFGHASQEFETALTLDGSREFVRQQLRDVLYDRALVAERDHAVGKLRDLKACMELYDIDGKRRLQWNAPATLQLTTNPPGATVKASRYQEDPQRRRRLILTAEQTIGTTPLQQVTLPPGSYLLISPLRIAPRSAAPVVLQRGEQFRQNIECSRQPPSGQLCLHSNGVVLLAPPAMSSSVRAFTTVPLHEVTTPSYLIARHETTCSRSGLPFGSADARRADTPHGARRTRRNVGSVALKMLGDGSWQLNHSPSPRLTPYAAASGSSTAAASPASPKTGFGLRHPASHAMM